MFFTILLNAMDFCIFNKEVIVESLVGVVAGLVVALVVVDFVVGVVSCVEEGGGLVVNLVFGSFPGVGGVLVLVLV